MSQKIYTIENLDCANCAAKIERKITELPEVQSATIVYTTKQLRIVANNPDELLEKIRKIATDLEPDVVITERTKDKKFLNNIIEDEYYNYKHEHHKHNEHCNCGHEHQEHNEHCNCGHEHQEHNEHCNCGYEHQEHNEHCNCGHEHQEHNEHCNCEHEHQEHNEHCNCEHEYHEHKSSKYPATIFILENLGCANCAAKMENKINALPNVDMADITYATKQLRVWGENPQILLPKIQKICSSIESEVVVKLKQDKNIIDKNVIKEKKTLIYIFLGTLLFAFGIATKNKFNEFSNISFVLSYIILGNKILLTALKNMKKGHIFDENFLMSIATIGAFVIGEFAEGVGVMLFYRIGEFFEDKAVEKSRNQIMNAIDMRPEVVNLVDNDKINVIDAQDAKVGDILLVKVGDRIPLDGTIVDGESRIDTSPVTGEPIPIKACVGDSVISGCMNTSAVIKIKVEKPLSESMVTRIMESVENAAASKPKIDRFITRFSRVYTPFVVIAAALTAIVPSVITGEWNYWIYTALTFLVISCPCALVLSVPLAFFSGIGAGSKNGILFKGGISIESLKNVKAVVMDKTGTLTEGNFIVQNIISIDEEFTQDDLLSLAASCEFNSKHPIGNSIVTAAKAKNLNIEQPKKLEEIAGKGISANISRGQILCGNRELMNSFNIALNKYDNGNFGTEVFIALNGKFIGNIIISDTIKNDSKNAVSLLKNQGILTAMLTGDSYESAKNVSEKLGIDKVYAKLMPNDKLNILKSIREKYGSVMFVGDGINDAPVLAGADVGAAMGSGADAAIEAADVVFMTSNMNAVPQAISIAKITASISIQNVAFALIIKALVLVLGFFGLASMWLAVFADSGVAMLCVLNSIRILYKK